MKKNISALIAAALFLFAGLAYGEDTEVWGDFSVNGGNYYYTRGNTTSGLLTPRCLFDTSVNTMTDPAECPSPGFYTDIDQGATCYDQMDFATSPDYHAYASYIYTRSIASTPSFVVTKTGDAYVPTQGTGLILRATTGAGCYRITVNSSGVLQQAFVTCP